MGIDASIYSQFKPVDYFGSIERGIDSGMQAKEQKARLSDLARQREDAHAEKQLIAQQKQFELNQKRQNVMGQAFESMEKMTPEQRATAYHPMRQQLIAQGMADEKSLPEMYDDNKFLGDLKSYKNSDFYLDRMKKKADIAKTNAEANRKENDPNLWWKQEQREMARQKHIDSNVGKLQDNLGNTQDAVRSIKDVESTLGFQLEDYDPKKDDLPGVSIPGLGRFTQFNGKARDLNSSMAKIFNTVLKDRSGAAVTTPELDRLREEFNTGKYNDEEELIGAAKRYKAGMMAKMQDIEAGANPNAVAEYRNRRGTTSQDLAYREGQRKKDGQHLDKYGANAGPVPTPPAGMILMRDPKGRMKYVRETQKGEAIAAGGEVVK